MSILSVDNISYTYTTASGRKIEAVKAVSFSVEPGEYIAILGRNGSGKSTLARLITGFLTPDSGTVTLPGAAAQEGRGPLSKAEDAGEGRSELSRQRAPAGIVFQDPKTQIIATIAHTDTEFGPENLGASGAEAAQTAATLLDVVKLSEKAAARTTELSLGQMQKLALAGILALEPGLLVLDEAVSMIDPETRAEILGFIDERHHAGDAIISITHDISQAMRADRVLAFESGTLIADESRDIFAADSALKERLFGTAGLESTSRTSSADARVGLSFEDVTFAYPGAEKPLFNKLNLAFKSGTITAIMGESGSGKSTLFELAAGLLTADSGAVRGAGRPALALQDSEGALFEVFTADDVAYGPRNAGLTGKPLKACVEAAMQKAGLPFAEFADRPVLALSGGEKRRASLAGIIALNRDVILFDEPCAGLDIVGRRHIAETMRSLAAEGKTVLFSTHYEEETEFADRVIRLEAGNVKADSAPVAASGPQRADAASDTGIAGKTDALTTLEPLDNGFLTRLKQTSGGLFQNVRSPVSRLPAWTKILLFLAVFITSLVFQAWQPCCIMIGVSLVYALLARLPFGRPVKTILRLIPWIILFTIIQILLLPVAPDDIILAQFGFVTITQSCLEGALNLVLHLIPAIFSIFAFLASSDETDLVDGLKVLTPGKTVAVTVLVIIRFIPLLAEEASLIIKVQLIRGGLTDTRGFFNRVRSLLPLFVPLISRTLDRAEDMADALTARYF